MSADDARGARGRAVVAALASGVALFAVAAPTWFSVEVTTLLHGETTLGVNGAGAVPALTGVALVLLAAGGALGIVGRAGRRVVGGLVLLAGTVAAWLVLSAVRAPAGALRRTVAEHTGVGAVPRDLVETSPWPFATFAVIAVVLALGAAHVLGAGPWPSPGAKVRQGSDRPVRADAPSVGEDPTGVWDTLSDGGDPTAPGRLP